MNIKIMEIMERVLIFEIKAKMKMYTAYKNTKARRGSPSPPSRAWRK